MQSTKVKAVLGAAIALAWGSGLAAAAPIAHWSFDSNSLSFDGSGNITGAADAMGNHNAFVDTVTGVGTSGAVTPSAAFAGSDSVAGSFGQALKFDGNNYMEYPELRELMTAAGAPSYTVSLWLNIPSSVTAPGNAYTTMGDWGNASSDGTSSKFVYGFGPNTTTSIRAQTRYNNPTNGTDLYQANADIPNAAGGAVINDGAWHMLSWTWDSTNNTGESYFDGVDLGSFGRKNGTTEQMADAASLYGTFGFKGDHANFIPAGTQLDEVWAFNQALAPDQISALFTTNSVPEPASLSLLLLGAGSGLLRRRRSR